MEVRALPPSQILRNFRRYLPIAIIAAFLYWVFLSIGLCLLLGQWVQESTARIVGLSTTTILVSIGLLLYVLWVGKRFSRCRMELSDETLTIRGETNLGTGIIERRYELQDIQLIAIGEKLNPIEQLLDKLSQLGIPKTSMKLTKDMKAGRMLIVDTQGKATRFHFVDKVFERAAFLELVEELMRRGVHFECGLA